MNEADKRRSAEQAAANRAYLGSPEMRAINDRLIGKTATLADVFKYVKAELCDALDSLPPSAPENGRTVDGFHACCAVLRALCALVQGQDAAVRVAVVALKQASQPKEQEKRLAAAAEDRTGGAVPLLHELIGEWFVRFSKAQAAGGTTATLHDYIGVKYEDYVRWVNGELSSEELYDLRTPGVAP